MSQLATLILSYFEEEMRHHYIVSGSHGPCALDNELIRTKQQAKYQISEFDIFFVRNEEVARRINWKKKKKKKILPFFSSHGLREPGGSSTSNGRAVLDIIRVSAVFCIHTTFT